MPTSLSQITILAPPARVWTAITRPEWVKQWQFGADLSTDWQVGSPILFRNEWEGQVFEQKGTILALEPGRSVSYTLFFARPGLEDQPENYFTMTYLLEDTIGGTLLTIRQDDPRSQDPQPQAEEGENAILEGLKKLVESSEA